MPLGRELVHWTAGVAVIAAALAIAAGLPILAAVGIGVAVAWLRVGFVLAISAVLRRRESVPVTPPPAAAFAPVTPAPAAFGPVTPAAFAPVTPAPAPPAPVATTPAPPVTAPVAPPVEERAFVRVGDYWSVTFSGRTTNVKDSKGMRYLHALLRQPGVDLHVTELAHVPVAGDRPAVNAAAAAQAGLHVSGTSDAGPVLDAQAKAAYRRRIEDLQEELEEARAWNDAGRVARAEYELDALAAELSRAMGLGGQDRRAASEAERLRVNVTRAIRTAIERIGEHDPALAAHLTQAVRTGGFCRYRPDDSDRGRWAL